MKLLIILSLLIGLAGAVQPVDLCNFTKEDAKAFGMANAPLGAFDFWAIPNFGPKTSETNLINQSMKEYVGLPQSMTGFISFYPPIPASIGG